MFPRRIREFAQRNFALVILASAFYFATALAFMGGNIIERYLSYFSESRLAILTGLITLMLLITLFYRFLRFYLNPEEDNGRYSKPLPERTAGEVLDKLENRIRESLSRIEKRTAGLGQGRQMPELFESTEEKERFKNSLIQEIKSEVATNLDQEIVAQLSNQSKFSQAEVYQVQTKDRLQKVVSGLERRANLNLSVGATIGGSGIVLLIYLLYIAPPTNTTTGDYTLLALQYFARVSIVFLIEVFAFFFLKLYSQTLGELRHTHNEITNIDMKLSGMQAAIASSDKRSIAHAIQRAVDTERNFVLDKGKTTVDLEKYRNDSDSTVITTKILRDLFFAGRADASRPKAQKD